MKICHNITDRNDFLCVSMVFGEALKTIAPTAGVGTEYLGKTLYQPFQIAVIGKPHSGKSSIIKIAADEATSDHADTEYQTGKMPSHDQTRMITVASQWLTKEFEIRAQDEHAVAALPARPEFLKEDFTSFGIRFFEHPSDELIEYCPLVVRLLSDGNGERELCFEAKENDQAQSVLEDMKNALA